VKGDKRRGVISVCRGSSAAIWFCLLATGCGRYASFTLPEVRGGDPSLVFRFVAEPEPVIPRGEFRDALNPSVTGRVNLYSVYDGQWHTALATSEDGVHWRQQGIVLRAAAGSYIAGNGSALSDGGRGWYWYETGAEDRLQVSLWRAAGARTRRAGGRPGGGGGAGGGWGGGGWGDRYGGRCVAYCC